MDAIIAGQRYSVCAADRGRSTAISATTNAVSLEYLLPPYACEYESLEAVWASERQHLEGVYEGRGETAGAVLERMQ